MNTAPLPRSRRLEPFLILLAVLAVCLSIFKFDTPSIMPPAEQMRELSNGWYRTDGGKIIPVTLPCTITLENDQDLVLFNGTLTDEDGGLTVSTQAGLYRLQIALSDTILYTYEDSGFPRNEQMRAKLHCTASLPLHLGSGVLTLTYENQGDGVFQLAPVYIGLSGAVFRSFCINESFTLMAVFAMGLLSIVAAGISVYLRLAHMKVRRFSNTAAFLLLCGAWFALDSALAQHLSGDSPVVCYLSFYAFMSMAIPMLYFVKNTSTMDHFPILQVLIWGFYLNILFQSVVDYFGLYSFIDMLWITHLLLVITCITVPFLMLREYQLTRDRELKTILSAFVCLIFSGLLALLMYWVWDISYYGYIFECGLLLFIAYLLSFLTITMANSMHFKDEAAIYKQLSTEDRLTGLANRRSYEDFLSHLGDTAESYENAALIFLDMNRLKHVNDHYGHTAGDELIVRAARCIESAFAKQGSCYRIGGDEFAVIMLNPVGCQADWNRWLDDSIQKHNQTGQHALSIARGISLLRDENNQLKTISDWKFEADQAMYRYKKQQKQWPFSQSDTLS